MTLTQLSIFSFLTVGKSHSSFIFSLIGLGKFFIVVTSLTGCLDLAGSCETEISRRVFNPDKSLQAITVITDCGATTATAYGVRLVESSDTTDDGILQNTIVGSNNGVGIKWISNDTLSITGADTTNGHTMKTRFKLNKTSKEVIIIYTD